MLVSKCRQHSEFCYNISRFHQSVILLNSQILPLFSNCKFTSFLENSPWIFFPA